MYEQNYMTFNCKKTVCIKFGSIVKEYEHAWLNNQSIKWVNSVKHLGNHINNDLSDTEDFDDNEIDIMLKYLAST